MSERARGRFIAMPKWESGDDVVLYLKFTDPRQNAYSITEKMRRDLGWNADKIQRAYPELYRLSTEWNALRSRVKNQGRYNQNRKSAAIIDHLSWDEIVQMRYRYGELTRKKISHTEPDFDVYRMAANYYNRVVERNRAKRARHPEIKEMSLGYDPRERQWPSGKIERPLYFWPLKKRRKAGPGHGRDT